MSLDLLHARVAFRDRPIVDVLDLAVRFIVSHARLYAVVSVFVVVPFLLLSLAAAKAWDWMTGWVFAICLGTIAQTAFTILASRLVFEEDVRARDVIKDSLRRMPAMSVARVVVVVAAAVGGTLCVVPAFWVVTALFFITEVMLLERAPLGTALTRSQKLASASTGGVVIAVLLLTLLLGTAVTLTDVAGRTVIEEVLQFRGPAPFWTDGGSVLAFVGFFVVMPYAATARFFTYLNVRTRAEGWDIQTRFAAIAVREGEPR
jgi:hypothetical protein